MVAVYISDSTTQAINFEKLKLVIRACVNKLKPKLNNRPIANDHFKMVAFSTSANSLGLRQFEERTESRYLNKLI